MVTEQPSRGEFELIEKVLAPLARAQPGAFGLREDAAVLSATPGRELVITTDAMIAGVHFASDEEPALVARKLLRVNLSDLAAMGAREAAHRRDPTRNGAHTTAFWTALHDCCS